jgi:hypothetical protein
MDCHDSQKNSENHKKSQKKTPTHVDIQIGSVQHKVEHGKRKFALVLRIGAETLGRDA